MIKESPKVPGTGALRQLLFSTLNRTTQQSADQKDRAFRTKELMRGKKFKTRKTPPMFCKSKKIFYMVIKNGKLEKIIIGRIGCNSWTCPDCQVKKAIQLKYLLLAIARLNNISYHMVLTLDPKTIPIEYWNEKENSSHRYITRLFNHFKTIITRKKFRYYNKNKKRFYAFNLKKESESLKYLWVLQYQPQTGVAHLHILLNKFLPIVEMRKVWRHIGGGLDVWIEKVKTVEGMSRYVTDYIVSGIKEHNCHPKGGFNFFERRYSIGRKCIRPDKVGKRIFKELSDNEMREKLATHNLDFIVDELNDPNALDLEITYEDGKKPKIERISRDS